MVFTAVPRCPTSPEVEDIRSTRCTVTCRPASDDTVPVTGFLVERRTPGQDWVRLDELPVTQWKYVVRRLVPRTQYQFRLAAVNQVDVGDFSEPSAVITTGAPSAPDQPCPPFVVNLVGISVTLVWTAPDDGGEVITGYVVRFGVPGTDVSSYAKIRFDGDTTTCLLMYLKPKTKYQFAVSAENKVGCGPPSKFSEHVITCNYSSKYINSSAARQ